MRQAMRDVITRYPSDWNAANFAKLACQIGDGNDAAVYLGMIRRFGDTALNCRMRLEKLNLSAHHDHKPHITPALAPA